MVSDLLFCHWFLLSLLLLSVSFFLHYARLQLNFIVMLSSYDCLPCLFLPFSTQTNKDYVITHYLFFQVAISLTLLHFLITAKELEECYFPLFSLFKRANGLVAHALSLSLFHKFQLTLFPFWI